MNESSYNKIWTTIGLFTSYNAINMYLYIQGSEIAFPFPDFSKAARDTISIYSMITYIPSFFALMVVLKLYQSNKENQIWKEKIPIAFNLNIDLKDKLGIYYQRFFFFIFLILPPILQIHSLKKFFTTHAYTRDGHNEIASDFISHLFNWQPNPLANEYIFGETSGNPVTYFPFFEPWIFLFSQLGLFFFLIINLKMVFKD